MEQVDNSAIVIKSFQDAWPCVCACFVFRVTENGLYVEECET